MVLPIKESYTIVVIGGGGIRGLTAIQVVRYAEHVLRGPLSMYADAVYGTSTGAIIAGALSMPRMLRGDQLEAAYESLATKVFSKRFASLGGWAGPMYSAAPLQFHLKKMLGAHTDLGEAVIPTGIVTYNLETREPEMWCSYGLNAQRPLWQACRASSAAPTFFPPFENYCDGGLVANLPSAWAAIDFARTFGVPFNKIRVLAIGTGTSEAPIRNVEGRGKVGWIEDVIEIGMTGSQDLEEILCRSLGLAGYLQLQIALPAEAAAMDNVSPENLKRLKQLGNAMCAQKIGELNKFLDAMALPVPPASPEIAA